MNENKKIISKITRLSTILLFVGLVVILLVAAELFFDIFEIAMGRLLLFSNPIRPQTGRLWEEDLKEQLGLDELDSVKVDRADESIHQSINSLDDLEAVLSIRQSMSMTRVEFNEFYKKIPQNLSRQILDPLDLFTMNRNSEWHKTQLSLSGAQLVFHFLDGYEKPIRESHMALRSPEEERIVSFSELEQMEKYRGRVVPATIFYQAFDQLPRAYQLQIVNDPYKLVQWENILQRVGLSLYVEKNGVEIMFEISEESRTKLQSMYASEMAIEYLIREINAIEDAPKLQTPYRRDFDAEKDR